MVQGTAAHPCRSWPRLQPRSRHCTYSEYGALAKANVAARPGPSRARQYRRSSVHQAAVKHGLVCCKVNASCACIEPSSSPFQGLGALQRRSLLAWTAVCRALSILGKPASAQAAKGPGRGRRFFPAVPPSPKLEGNEGAMRVYLISDIHTDYEENLAWIRGLSEVFFQNDALIVAGDVSDSIFIFEETFQILRPKFAHVFFTPGNHDLWLRGSASKPLVKTSEPLSKPSPEPAFEPTTPLPSDEGARPASQSAHNGPPEGESRKTSGGPKGDENRADEMEHSVSKLGVLFDICARLGVDTRPKFLRPPGRDRDSQRGAGELTVLRSRRRQSSADLALRTGPCAEDSLGVDSAERGASRTGDRGTPVKVGTSEVSAPDSEWESTAGTDSASEARLRGRSNSSGQASGDSEESAERRDQADTRESNERAEGKAHAGVWVVPILAWHHRSFDTEPDIPGYNIPPVQKVAKDYKVCKWPSGWDPMTESVALSFDAMNEELHRDFDTSSTPGCHVITFSHFLPRLELIPEKRFLFYPNLAKAVGSHSLEARVRAVHAKAGGNAPACHLFGHTHFVWDSTIEGVRYIQAPLAYPKERKRRMNGGTEWLPLCVYDSSLGGVLRDEVPCHWSDYYRTHPREPNNFEFAPWVANLWKPARGKAHAQA